MSLLDATIVQVWDDNLIEAFDGLGNFIDWYSNVSFCVAYDERIDNHDLSVTNVYDHIRSKTGDLKPIRLGLALTDANGDTPDLGDGRNSWQFNFIPGGVDFQTHGIDIEKFAELLMSSGLVCNPDVTSWVTFNGAFDFGLLVKMLSGQDLPEFLPNFMDRLKVYFGANAYDVKNLISHCSGLSGDLHQVSRLLELEADLVGEDFQQAETDSLLTWKVFEKIKDLIPGGPEMFAGVIYGLEEV